MNQTQDEDEREQFLDFGTGGWNSVTIACVVIASFPLSVPLLLLALAGAEEVLFGTNYIESHFEPALKRMFQ